MFFNNLQCSTYCGEVVIWTKASVDAPDLPVLAKKLCIEERIHLDQQSFPVALSLQERRVGQSFAVKTSALHEEPAFLFSTASSYATVVAWTVFTLRHFSQNNLRIYVIKRCNFLILLIMPRPRREGAISIAFVRPSVCPSVAYIANNSRIQRPSMPKFGRKVPHLRCDSHTSFEVKRSKSRSPGPLMLTHIVRHILQTARPTNFKRGIRMEDDDPHQPQAPWPPRSKVKVARSRDQSEPCWPNGP